MKVRTAPVTRSFGEVAVGPEPVRNHGNLKAFPDFDDSWKTEAACRDADPTLFMAYQGWRARMAIAYCADCPVVDECSALAMLHVERNLPVTGVWGGQVWTTSGNRSTPNLRRLRRIL